jgi:hypothetical protein
MDCGRYRKNGYGINEIRIDCLEPDFNRVFMVDQSLRLSTMKVWKEKSPEAEEALIVQMVGIVRLLFPHHSEDEIRKGVNKVVKKALSVKKHISEEKALYYCSWVKGEKDFAPDSMHLSGDQSGGKVAFCTFPGLIRIHLELNEKVPNCVVKASVLMQTDISE